MIKIHTTIFIMIAVVVAALIYIFLKVGDPNKARNQKFDQTRVSNLTNIKYSVESYYYKNKSVPQTLTQLRTSDSYYSTQSHKDPETGKEYEYQMVSTANYKLCATFATDTKNLNESDTYNSRSLMIYNDNSFLHPKGYYCFELAVKQDLYNYNYSTPTPTPTPTDPRKPMIIRPRETDTLCIGSTAHIEWWVQEDPDETLIQIEEPLLGGTTPVIHTILRAPGSINKQSKTASWAVGSVMGSSTKLAAGDNYKFILQTIYNTPKGSEQHMATRLVHLSDYCPPTPTPYINVVP